MLLILFTANRLILDTLEEKLKNFRINFGGTSISADDGVKLLKRGLGSDFESFVLG